MDRRKFVLGAATIGAAPAFAQAPRPALARAALVLGGGGCRGYGHVGVIRVLEANGLKPDLVVGSSVGSLVGALYAAGLSAGALERLGDRVNPNMLRDWIFPKLGFFGGEGIARFVRDAVRVRDIESLPVRFAAVATDLSTGEIVLLDRGDLGVAVQASSSAPGLLEPVRLGGRLLVDGNLSAPVPIEAARRLGAERIVAVDVTFPPQEADLADPFDALYQGFSILTRRLALEERRHADVLLEPHMSGRHEHMSPDMIRSMTEGGERAALEALPRLRQFLATRSGPARE